MRLYLMQHGRPVAKKENPDRPSLDQGKEDVERVALAASLHILMRGSFQAFLL